MQVMLAKYIVVTIMVIAGAFQTLNLNKMEELMPKSSPAGPPSEGPPAGGPPPELQVLINRQAKVAPLIFILGITTLLLTAIAEAI